MDDNGDGVATQTKNSYGKLPAMSLAYQVSEQLVQLDDGQAPVARFDRCTPPPGTSGTCSTRAAGMSGRGTGCADGVRRAAWVKQMIEEARETEGISERTLRRAKDELGLAASKDKTRGNGAW